MEMTPFLMFTGQAEAAMDLYVSLFPQARIVSIERFGPGDTGAEGTIKRALFEVGGRTVMCFDSPPVHAFGFTPSISLFVECDDEAQQLHLVEGLAEGGKTLMPLDHYGFSRRFAWVEDRYGVSWQLNLP